jgi:hypothetical protein
MVQTTLHITEDQKTRIDRLPRGISFSKMIRDNFDYIMEEYESRGNLNIKAV